MNAAQIEAIIERELMKLREALEANDVRSERLYQEMIKRQESFQAPPVLRAEMIVVCDFDPEEWTPEEIEAISDSSLMELYRDELLAQEENAFNRNRGVEFDALVSESWCRLREILKAIPHLPEVSTKLKNARVSSPLLSTGFSEEEWRRRLGEGQGYPQVLREQAVSMQREQAWKLLIRRRSLLS